MDKLKAAADAALEWCKANTAVSIPLATFALGVAVGVFIL